MIGFLTENYMNIIVGLVVLAIIAGAVFVMVSDKKKGKSPCGGKCGGCANAGLCHGGHDREGTK